MDLFIFGSCVSRDALNQSIDRGSINLKGYYSRTSFASQILSPCQNIKIMDDRIASFLRRMHDADCGRHVFEQIENTNFDIILIDFIDNRFDLIQVDSNCVITATPEVYVSLPYCRRGRLIKSGSLEYMSLWKCGFDAMHNLLERTGQIDKLRINCVYWAPQGAKGVYDGISTGDIDRANERLDYCYNYILSRISSVRFYRYPNNLFVSDPLHHTITHKSDGVCFLYHKF